MVRADRLWSVLGPTSDDNRSDVVSSTGSDVDEEHREKWGSKLDFILSCIGYAVGMGNLLRFPYICGRNGGAAFMIPYVIMMIFTGFPAFYLELALGQFSQVSPILLYRRCVPLFAGVGPCMIAITFLTSIYYNLYLAWSLRYMFDSFTLGKLPYVGCTHDYNTDFCYDDRESNECQNKSGLLYFHGRCWNDTEIYQNQSLNDRYQTALNHTRVSPTQEYNDYVLGFNSSAPLFDQLGMPKWDLVVALAIAWILVFFVLIRGVKSSGKVVYFTATFPYLILIILCVKGNMLPNSIDGVKFYMIPNFTKLKEPQVWGDAAVQIFFSLSVGGGGLTTLATYNAFDNNLLRDSIIVVIGNCLTSFFAGFVIFPILGFVAAEIYPNMDSMERVAKIAASGPTLAFVSYPDAFTRINPPQLWSFLFFFMLIILGIDTQLVLVEVVITMFVDMFPSLNRKWYIKAATVASICCCLFGLGLLLTTPAGPALLNLMDTFAGGWTLVISCFFEIAMVSWFYGYRRFIADIHMMMGVAPNTCWRFCGYPVNFYWWINWLVITPIILFAVLIFNFIFYDISYNNKEYPHWAVIMGWLFAVICIIWIPLGAIYACFQAVRQNKGYRWLFKSTASWGPQDTRLRRKVAREHPYSGRNVSLRKSQGYDNPGFNSKIKTITSPYGEYGNKNIRPISYRNNYGKDIVFPKYLDMPS